MNITISKDIIRKLAKALPDDGRTYLQKQNFIAETLGLGNQAAMNAGINAQAAVAASSPALTCALAELEDAGHALLSATSAFDHPDMTKSSADAYVKRMHGPEEKMRQALAGMQFARKATDPKPFKALIAIGEELADCIATEMPVDEDYVGVLEYVAFATAGELRACIKAFESGLTPFEVAAMDSGNAVFGNDPHREFFAACTGSPELVFVKWYNDNVAYREDLDI